MKKILTLILCLFFFAGLTFASGCQKAEEEKAPAVTPAPAPEEMEAEEEKPAELGEETITGKVSEQGNIVADDGEEFIVAAEDMRKELMGLVNKKIKATGAVEEREGEMVISVTSYEVIEE